MKKILLFSFSCFTSFVFSQVGIGTVNPDSTAILDINNANSGLLIPRVNLLSTTDTSTISTPSTSLLIYNLNTTTDVTPGFYYWNGSLWLRLLPLISDSSSWSINGNSNTNQTTNFIGTTDDNDLIIKQNSTIAGKINPINTLFGKNALFAITTGISNTAFGRDALKNNITGNYNTAFGRKTLTLNTESNNSSMGFESLNENFRSFQSTATGFRSLRSLTSIIGPSNTAIGSNSHPNLTNGLDNTVVGFQAAFSNKNRPLITVVGYRSLYSLNNPSSGGVQTCIGARTSENLIDDPYNTTAGYMAFQSIYGQYNIAIGYNTIISGNNNNRVRIGDTNITYAGIQVPWTITSDRSWKNTIKESNLGLQFIQQLRPVSYFRNNDENKKLEYGFIAQELQKTLIDNNVKNSSIVSEDDTAMLGVRYNDLLATMIKATQEQQALLDNQEKIMKKQKATLEQLAKRLYLLEKNQ